MTSSNGNIFRVTGHLWEFPVQRPVTRSLDVFFDLCLNKRLSKQSWGWWFETPSRPLWRHCNVSHCPRKDSSQLRHLSNWKWWKLQIWIYVSWNKSYTARVKKSPSDSTITYQNVAEEYNLANVAVSLMINAKSSIRVKYPIEVYVSRVALVRMATWLLMLIVCSIFFSKKIWFACNHFSYFHFKG